MLTLKDFLILEETVLKLMNKENIKNYTDLDAINVEVQKSKQLFKKFNWPTIDVTRKSVEETAASIIKKYMR